MKDALYASNIFVVVKLYINFGNKLLFYQLYQLYKLVYARWRSMLDPDIHNTIVLPSRYAKRPGKKPFYSDRLINMRIGYSLKTKSINNPFKGIVRVILSDLLCIDNFA